MQIDFTSQILALDSAVVNSQSLFISGGGFLTYPMYHQVTYYDERKSGPQRTAGKS